MATAEPDWRPNSLGGILAYARRDAGLSQEALADACGVSRPLVSKWEIDERLPEFSEIETWAATTGAKWLIPTLKKLGLLVKVERWELSTFARLSHGLTGLPSQLDRRYRSPMDSPLLTVVTDDH